MNVLAADPRGELRAAAHRGGAGDACALHRKRADVVLLGFGLGDGAHPELAVFVGAPRERDAGVGDDHGVTLAAGTGDDAVVGKGLDDGGGGAVVEVAVAELARLVAAPGEHAAVLGDGHAVRRGAAAAHRRDGDAGEGGDAGGFHDVRGCGIVLRGGERGKGDAGQRSVDASLLKKDDAPRRDRADRDRGRTAGLPRPTIFQSVMPVKSSSPTTMFARGIRVRLGRGVRDAWARDRMMRRDPNGRRFEIAR